MDYSQPVTQLGTHDVFNQPDPKRLKNYWSQDRALQDHAGANGARGQHLSQVGARFGSEVLQIAAEDARRDLPRLKLFDRAGRRVDEVEFHPGYHQLMAAGLEAGYASVAWDGQAGGHATHAAMVYYQAQLEPGVACPLTMTYAAVPALRNQPELEDVWNSRLTSGVYDPSLTPIEGKAGATLGMAMTEKQGGSDVRANTTVARRDGDHYRLRGHKWFCSAPMCDGFLTLAQAEGGLTCFLVPRWLEGERNGLRLQRLKDKLGNKANASSEIEYHDALAYRVGEEGAGVRTIIEMVHHTRLDTVLAPAGLMRAALEEAHWWVNGRSTFQKRLIDQPLMRSVLADLAVDTEAALSVGMMLAGAFDRDDDESRALARIGVALAKYLNNKRCIGVIAEAMEVLGGMGYVEETPMPMIYREAPLNGIWEGSGNVICLDVLRALVKQPAAGDALMNLLASVTGSDARYDAALKAHVGRWPRLPAEAEARWFTESLANLLTAASLIKTAPSAVAEGFVGSRVAGDRGSFAGAVSDLRVDDILARLEVG
ncbi:acyl-CoA dehydrogenase family protein [Shimia haliotis]|uniref:Putative acyl-CoA dehydrogenase n=1 Tax=Shimia haliotis TaxID=1280847 RepID=A0A1I4BC32_9RHOB|nr:acyl-CoA dehydrogenase family protein [Shimia haliotis]SFK66372.1 putative acyl-CoA dehydrogenase [Shimia haliotis]